MIQHILLGKTRKIHFYSKVHNVQGNLKSLTATIKSITNIGQKETQYSNIFIIQKKKSILNIITNMICTYYSTLHQYNVSLNGFGHLFLHILFHLSELR